MTTAAMTHAELVAEVERLRAQIRSLGDEPHDDAPPLGSDRPPVPPEHLLREREIQLALALDIAELGTWRHNLVTGAIALDARTRAQYGIVADSYTIADVLARIHPDDVAYFQRTLAAALASSSDGRYLAEYRVVHLDDSVHWLTVRGQVVFDSSGDARRPVFRYGTVQDITERKATEAALQEARTAAEEHAALLDTLIAHAPVGIAFVDTDMRYQHINRYLAAINGPPPEAHLGRTFREVLPELAPQLEAFYQRTLGGGQPVLDLVISGETSAAPGEQRSWIASFFPIRTGDGRLLGAGTIVSDITERRSLEQKLMEEHRQRESILQTLQEALFAFHADGTFVLLNDLARQAIGGAEPPPSVHALAAAPVTFFTAEGLALPREKLPALRVLRGETFTNTELRLQHPGQEARWLSFSGAPAYDETGQLALGVVTAHDITARKLAQAGLQAKAEALSRSNAELARAVRFKDEFLAMMSHELRTPLTLVLGLTEMLTEESYGPITQEQREALARVELGGRHLLALLSDILDLSRIEAGAEQLEIEDLDIDLVAAFAIHTVQHRAAQKGIQLSHAIDPAVETIRGDERRLRQILVNLLDNAVKFTPEGGAVRLEITADPDQEQVHLSVSDTGIGIAPEDFDRLFQPFVQVEGGLRRAYGGVGLGLTLVQRLVDLHGGSVSLESTPGEGSRFSVHLPWSPRTHTAPTTPVPPPEAAASLSGTHVVVVDDDEMALELYSDVLTREGCVVLTARTGLEGLARVREARPDVVVLDIQLPELDGLGVLRQLRGEAATAVLPVIALTALAMPGDRERCLAAGATHYLTKPVALQTLRATVAACARGADQAR
ncbi:MAG: hypothetical protein RLZZ387_1371 [Chloroflexota bacterium]|jgi:PAS domain S-box-containing protein